LTMGQCVIGQYPWPTDPWPIRATSRVDSGSVGHRSVPLTHWPVTAEPLAELTMGQCVIGQYPWPTDPWPIRATSRVDSGSVGHRSLPVTHWPVIH